MHAGLPEPRGSGSASSCPRAGELVFFRCVNPRSPGLHRQSSGCSGIPHPDVEPGSCRSGIRATIVLTDSQGSVRSLAVPLPPPCAKMQGRSAFTGVSRRQQRDDILHGLTMKPAKRSLPVPAVSIWKRPGLRNQSQADVPSSSKGGRHVSVPLPDSNSTEGSLSHEPYRKWTLPVFPGSRRRWWVSHLHPGPDTGLRSRSCKKGSGFLVVSLADHRCSWPVVQCDRISRSSIGFLLRGRSVRFPCV